MDKNNPFRIITHINGETIKKDYVVKLKLDDVETDYFGINGAKNWEEVCEYIFGRIEIIDKEEENEEIIIEEEDEPHCKKCGITLIHDEEIEDGLCLQCNPSQKC